jgi:hypothetical protein
MKKKLVILFYSLFYFLSVKPALAACTVNGQDIPCSQFSSEFGWIFIVMGIVAMSAFIFWLEIFIDCIKRDFPNKVLWILLVLFTGILGAILYLIIVKNKKVEVPVVQASQPTVPPIPTIPQSPVMPPPQVAPPVTPPPQTPIV